MPIGKGRAFAAKGTGVLIGYVEVSIFGAAGLPGECRRGHPWGPGKVLIGWQPCRCRGGWGHHWAACEEPGCSEIWYYPRHVASQPSGDGQASGPTSP